MKIVIRFFSFFTKLLLLLFSDLLLHNNNCLTIIVEQHENFVTIKKMNLLVFYLRKTNFIHH
jgi:hypothetical protein